MTVSWIVVADSGSARIFSAENPGTHWQEIADLTHAESRMSGSELGSSRPGRSHDSLGKGRHALEPQTSQKRKQSGVFARELADYLKRNDGLYTHLILVCAPRFLGEIRKQLDKSTTNKITREISSDVVHESLEKIQTLVINKSP